MKSREKKVKLNALIIRKPFGMINEKGKFKIVDEVKSGMIKIVWENSR